MPDEPSLELPSIFRRKRPSPPAVEEGRSPVSRPHLPALPAAALTGALVALLAAGLVWLANHGCADVSGTPSCGDAGYGLWLVILALVLAGAVGMLKVLGVPHPGSTATLGVALLVVLEMLSLDDRGWLVSTVLAAVLGAVGFGLAQRLTSSFTEPGDRPR